MNKLSTTQTPPSQGILNRQDRRSATGQRFTATIVQGLRHHWKIPC